MLLNVNWRWEEDSWVCIYMHLLILLYSIMRYKCVRVHTIQSAILNISQYQSYPATFKNIFIFYVDHVAVYSSSSFSSYSNSRKGSWKQNKISGSILKRHSNCDTVLFFFDMRVMFFSLIMWWSVNKPAEYTMSRYFVYIIVMSELQH